MSSCTTQKITVHAGDELDLAGSLVGQIRVPTNALSCRIIASRSDATAWGGSLTVESISGPLATTTTIADPGVAVLDAIATLGVDELDGVSTLIVIPPATGAGKVRLRAVFTVVDPNG